ncbi:hypothetical protein LQW54_008575 [Pestalotiopsis sp. IQ-011]
MDFVYSKEVGPDLYETHGLAGGIPLRHAMENLDLKGSLDQNFGSILEPVKIDSLKQELNSKMRPEKWLLARMVSEMMALDAERAVTSIKAWAAFVQLASKTRREPFETLAEYVPARVIDAGELMWFGVLTFGMALTIPESEYDRCMQLARPGYAALGLTNDLYSWEKEKQDALRLKQEYVFNSIWVIMREMQVTEEQAKAICAEEIKKHVSEFTGIVETAKKDDGLSKDLRTYLEAVMYSCSGNLVWSITCPRYHEF